MKIAPLAKIAAAKKRLIERTKEMKMKKIDVEALWNKASGGYAPSFIDARDEFARLIIEACATAAWNTGMQLDIEGPRLQEAREVGAKCAAAIRALKP